MQYVDDAVAFFIASLYSFQRTLIRSNVVQHAQILQEVLQALFELKVISRLT
jgi:hypothetical protein